MVALFVSGVLGNKRFDTIWTPAENLCQRKNSYVIGWPSAVNEVVGLIMLINGKEKPRGLAPVGVIVLLAAIQLLKVLHASNP